MLQITFFNTYYETMKFNETESIGNEIAASYSVDNVSEIPPQGLFRKGMIIRRLSTDGYYMESEFVKRDRRLMIENERLSEYIDRLNESDKNYLIEIISDNFRGSDNMPGINRNIIYISKVADESGKTDSYLYIMTPLSPTDATVNVLKSQLILVTVIIVIISFLLSFFLARRLSKPIVRIKDSALKLSEGEYDVVFESGDYQEINELSNVLNYTAKELSKNEELRRDLIANVSHDLKTPLTIIKSYAEMITDISGDNKEKREEHLKVIVKETDRLTDLVNDILDLSKMEANTVELEMKEFDIAKTVKKIYEGFKVFSEYKNYNFTLECDDSLIVLGNEGRITQVIYNLIGNAVNYTGEDLKVDIRLFGNDDKVRFEVRDTGKGISKEDMPRVWDRYYKASKTNTREVNGSGIGLAIVKNVLKLHNADFGAESELNKGSAFWFEMNKLN